MKVIPLTDNKIKTARPEAKTYKIADGDGLRIKIKPNGEKYWELRYVLNGKQSSISLGKYPEVTLKQARDKRLELRSMVADGLKPTFKTTEPVFDDLITIYHKHRSDLSADYIMDCENLLRRDFKSILNMQLGDIKPRNLIECFNIMENRGLKSAPKKAGSFVDRLFKFACTKLMIESNPMASIDLTVLLKKHAVKNFAHITEPSLFKGLLCAINAGVMDINTRTALQLMPYVFVRPANIRYMLWSEIDFDNKLWTIPASKMKMSRDHIVPLTDTAIKIISTMLGNGSEYVFCSPWTTLKPLSENTLNVTLKRLGFSGIMTSHGFRHTASTMLHENMRFHNINSDVIEMQMAHVEKNSVKGVYNKALYMDDRIALMQWWSDYLDALQKNCP